MSVSRLSLPSRIEQPIPRFEWLANKIKTLTPNNVLWIYDTYKDNFLLPLGLLPSPASPSTSGSRSLPSTPPTASGSWRTKVPACSKQQQGAPTFPKRPLRRPQLRLREQLPGCRFKLQQRLATNRWSRRQKLTATTDTWGCRPRRRVFRPPGRQPRWLCRRPKQQH